MKKTIFFLLSLFPMFSMAQSPSTGDSSLGVIIIGFIAFLIMVVIIRAVFMITTITRNLKMQTELLLLIASKDADEATIAHLKSIYETREKLYYNKGLISRYK